MNRRFYMRQSSNFTDTTELPITLQYSFHKCHFCLAVSRASAIHSDFYDSSTWFVGAPRDYAVKKCYCRQLCRNFDQMQISPRQQCDPYLNESPKPRVQKERLRTLVCNMSSNSFEKQTDRATIVQSKTRWSSKQNLKVTPCLACPQVPPAKSYNRPAFENFLLWP